MSDLYIPLFCSPFYFRFLGFSESVKASSKSLALRTNLSSLLEFPLLHRSFEDKFLQNHAVSLFQLHAVHCTLRGMFCVSSPFAPESIRLSTSFLGFSWNSYLHAISLTASLNGPLRVHSFIKILPFVANSSHPCNSVFLLNSIQHVARSIQCPPIDPLVLKNRNRSGSQPCDSQK